MNKWVWLRIGSILIACIIGIFLSHDQDLRNTKFEDSSFVLAGGFTSCLAFFANLSIRMPPILSSEEMKRPSWRAPILGTAQTLDFLGWFILAMGACAGIYLRFAAPDHVRLGIFFFSAGAGILAGTWAYQWFRDDD